MKQIEKSKATKSEGHPVDRYSTWGNPHNRNNVDYSTLVFYSIILDKVIHFLVITIGILALVVVGMVIYIFINPDFLNFIFDDGSSVPCIYNPLTGKFFQ